MRIDPHVHCRDGKQAYKETIAHALKLCDAQGVDMIFDMPNTDPPLLTESDIEARLALVPRADLKRYRLYLGATTDERQLREAVNLVNQCYQVIGIKLYAGHSVGALALAREADQMKVYEILAAAGYHGVLAVHAEKETLFTRSFDSARPASHGLARPPQAETASIADQIAFARAAKFQGTLHICHLSTAASLELVKAARQDLNITCGVTPHHLLWSADHMKGREGLLYKVNPPLRELADTIALRQALKQGEIDWIETDHAPHAISDKLYPPYESGYPSLCLYRSLVEDVLPYWGMSEATIKNVTSTAIQRVFGERKFL
jgi:dihydroorotase